MRGKPNKRHYLEQLCRITPAYAGKTDAVFLFLDKLQDHPRVCGENKIKWSC